MSTLLTDWPLNVYHNFHRSKYDCLQMIIVGLKPSPQTQYKYVKPKSPARFHHNQNATKAAANDQPSAAAETVSESLSGCLAWLPVMKLAGVRSKENGKGMDVVAETTLEFIAFVDLCPYS
jgi:hypothetical protein